MTERSYLKSGLFVLTVVITVALMLVLQGEVAHADGAASSVIKPAKKITLFKVSNGEKDSCYIDGGNVISVKSSKKKVISAMKGTPALLWVKKTGKTKLTIKMKKNGKVRKYKCKVKVVKYKNPIKSLTIGSQNHAGAFARNNLVTHRVSPQNSVLKISGNPGWQVIGIQYYDPVADKGVKVSNGGKINIRQGDQDRGDLTITLRNSKYHCTYFLNMTM